jgi:pilus assembly protein Flp/PilA
LKSAGRNALVDFAEAADFQNQPLHTYRLTSGLHRLHNLSNALYVGCRRAPNQMRRLTLTGRLTSGASPGDTPPTPSLTRNRALTGTLCVTAGSNSRITIWRGKYIMQFIKNFLREDDGQGMVEYGIILGLVSVLAIGALTLMGGDISGVFNSVEGSLNGLPGAPGA